MREISFKGETVSYECVAELSKNYDSKNFKVDTEYMKINAAVLGNSTGLETVEGDDVSSALAAVHGRKYNNASVSIPFTREFVTKNYGKIDKVLRDIAAKTSGACAELQKMMTSEQVSEGREMSMRSQAIRDARKEIQNSGATFYPSNFSDANRSVRGQSRSKVFFEYGVGVSARRVENTTGLEAKGQFKRKNISSEKGESVTAYVTTADEAGLKRIPIMSPEMREKAEEIVYKLSLVVKEEIEKLKDNVTDEGALAALEAIRDKMPGNDKLKAEIPPYSEVELSKIRDWRDEIISNYGQI